MEPALDSHEPVASLQRSGFKTKTKKEKSKKTVQFFAGFQHGQISLGVHLAEEAYVSTDENCPIEDYIDYDYFGNSCDEYEDDDSMYLSNWKKGSKVCRSTSGNSKPKTKPNKTVRAAVIRRTTKRTEHVSENSSAQKENVEKKLVKNGVKKFGFDIYERRTELTNSKLHRRDHVSKARSKTYHRRDRQEDHPAALRHELRSDNIPKGITSDMSQIIDLQHRDLTPEDYELLLMLDESIAPKTVSSSVLESLRVESVEVAEVEGELCSICMEMYQTSQMVKTLPCDHSFHSDCIDHWLSFSSQNCPLDGLAITAT